MLKEMKELKELTEEQLEQINGGYVVEDRDGLMRKARM